MAGLGAVNRSGVRRPAHRAGIIAILIALAAAGCGPSATSGMVGTAPAARPAPEPTDSAAPLAELLALYAARDYFALAARLDALPSGDLTDRPELPFLRAVTATAFNHPAASNRHLAALAEERLPLPDTLQVKAGELELRNHLQLSDYQAAARAARSVLALEAADSATRADVDNMARAMAALRDVPPQRIVTRSASRIEREHTGRIPVAIGDSVRAYAMDTGANLSVLMRSEARALGLSIREAGLRVGTSTGTQVLGDVAVAPRLRLGAIELENVVFLVLPDEALTFGDVTIPGLIGFPVMDALGEVEFRTGGVLFVPAEVPDRGIRNLALPSLTPVIRVAVEGRNAICQFDTGAGRSSMYLPFYTRNRTWVEAAGQPDTVQFAGVGGERRMAVFALPDVRMAVGDTALTLERLNVHLESVKNPGQVEPDCNLGLDVIAAFGGYLINLRSMSFLPL